MKIFVIIISYLLLSINLLSQSWVQLPDFLGTERDDGISFVINSKAYCLTGLEVGWQCTGNGFVFDSNSETWSNMTSLPAGKERQYATGFSYNNKGYMLCGLNCSNVCLNDFWEYNPATNSWLSLSNFPGTARQGMSNFIINNKVYIVGGRLSDNSTINEVWEYNFTTTTWTQKNNSPITMWRGSAFAIDTIGYICYGMNNNTGYNHSIYKYNYVDDYWNKISNITLPARNYIGTAICNKKACLYGGQDSLNTITNNIVLFNPTDSSLTNYLGIPTIGRKGGMAFSLNDVFYITTGLNANQTRIKETWKNTNFVGINEFYMNSVLVKVYPNPFKDELYIDYSILNFEERAQLQLIELATGRMIENIELNQAFGTKQFNTKNLLSGNYIVTLSQNNKPIVDFRVISIK